MSYEYPEFNAETLGAYVMLSDGSFRLAQSREEWCRHMEIDNRRVALDEFENGVVSTVFLGLDHSFVPDSLPVLFETMVRVNDAYLDESTRRYSTYAEACEGHTKALAELREHLAAQSNSRQADEA
jgi:hypothetical protein